VRSAVPGVEWPALPGGAPAVLLSLLWQLERSQWLPPAEIERLQFRQLEALLAHAWQTVPFYRERLKQAGYAPGRPLTAALWRAIPVLTRAEVQAAGKALHSSAPPREHGSPNTVRSSGSTGRPIEAAVSGFAGVVFNALTLRDHAWHGRDLKGRLGGIRIFKGRAAAPPDGGAQPDWGGLIAKVFETGPSFGLSIAATLDQQAAWLARVDPHYLHLFPSVLRELLDRAAAPRPRSLRQVTTLAEPLDASLRELCRSRWGVPVVDLYSAQETGYLALQCPSHEHYHVQAESVYFEALAGDGRACAPGETGRAVATPLLNFTMPLIRYDVGDFVEAGAPCGCGRGLPVLSRIVGRVRNMITLASGERFWPAMGVGDFGEVLPVAQVQVVQKTLAHLEVRIVVPRRATPAEEARLREIVLAKVGHPFDISFAYPERIERGPGGKYEEFRSELP
jgi:phenylacetate-CoA ligase